MKTLRLLSLLMGILLISNFAVCLADDDGFRTGPNVPPPAPIEENLIAPLFEKGEITITEGWNLIAMPVLPAKPYAVEQFIKAVESPYRPIIGPILRENLNEGEVVSKDEKGMDIIILPRSYWKILVVAVYKNGQFERHPKEGVTYNMVPGEAYFVYAEYHGPRPVYMMAPGYSTPEWRAKTKVTICGKPLDIPVSLNLDRGWNGASILATELGTDPVIDQKDLLKQGIKATRVLFWSPEMQEWKIVDLPSAGTLSMVPDVGFFILCEENGLYIPGLTTEPSLPVPPFPPKPPINEIVEKHTGKVEGVYYLCYGTPPPYQYNLVSGDNTVIHLTAEDDTAAEQLADVAGSGEVVTVAGVMTTIEWDHCYGGISGVDVEKVKVLKVIAVYRAAISSN